jgi:hypothetical protein
MSSFPLATKNASNGKKKTKFMREEKAMRGAAGEFGQKYESLLTSKHLDP